MAPTHDNTFAHLMHDITRQLRKHFDRRATRFELTRLQWRTLKMIGRSEGLSQTELAEHLDMEPIPVGRVIDRLEKSGYIERRADPADRRSKRIFLTEQGNTAVDSIRATMLEAELSMLQDLDDAEVEAMLGGVQKIRSRIDQMHAQRCTQSHTEAEVRA